MASVRLRKTWDNMCYRCKSPIDRHYHRYGGRGITICKEWADSFEVFKEWAMSNGYRDDLTIDRIDNDGNYCPENCRWITHVENNRNRPLKNGNRVINPENINGVAEYRAKTELTQRDLAEKVGVRPAYISRLEAGEFNPSVLLAGKIAKALRTTVEKLWPA